MPAPMRRLLSCLLPLASLLTASCSQMDPRLPVQLKAPDVPNAPPVELPDAADAAAAEVAAPPVREPDTALSMLTKPTWDDAERLGAFASASLGRAKEALARVQAGNADS